MASHFLSWLFGLFLPVAQIPAAVETDASPYAGDSVDDVAIWVDSDAPERSLVLGTVKVNSRDTGEGAGIAVYDLAGRQLQFVEAGSPNNIDIRYGFEHEGSALTVVAVSNWWTNDVQLYTVDVRGDARQANILKALSTEPVPTGLESLRGLCMFQSHATGRLYYFANGKSGLIEQYEIMPEGSALTAVRVRVLRFDGLVEGCVADDFAEVLYVSEEDTAVWAVPAGPDVEGAPAMVVPASLLSAGPRPDIEGLAIYDTGEGRGYLIVSSQGDDRFLVFDRESHVQLGRFTIAAAGPELDGVSHTDGIEASSRYFGPGFPQGLFIAQDDVNLAPTGETRHQNFKLVDWRKIADALELAEGRSTGRQ